MIRALLFDLDGTLAETDTLHFEGWRDLLSGQGIEADWDCLLYTSDAADE